MASTAAIIDVLGGSKVFRKRPSSAWDLQTKVRRGLPYAAFESLVSRMGLRRDEVTGVLHVTRRTLARRKTERVLQPDESDRVFRVARILAQAEEVLGTEEKAAEWLRRNNRSLRNRSPLSLLDTEIGARAVEEALLRLEHGVIG